MCLAHFDARLSRLGNNVYVKCSLPLRCNGESILCHLDFLTLTHAMNTFAVVIELCTCVHMLKERNTFHFEIQDFVFQQENALHCFLFSISVHALGVCVCVSFALWIDIETCMVCVCVLLLCYFAFVFLSLMYLWLSRKLFLVFTGYGFTMHTYISLTFRSALLTKYDAKYMSLLCACSANSRYIFRKILVTENETVSFIYHSVYHAVVVIDVSVGVLCAKVLVSILFYFSISFHSLPLKGNRNMSV